MNSVKLLLEINKISRELSFSLSNHELGLLLYKKINKLMSINSFGLGQVNLDSKKIIFNFLVEKEKISKELSLTLNTENSYAYYCVKNKKDVIINNIEKEENNFLKKNSILLASERNFKSFIYLPIYSKNQAIGFLTVQDSSYNFFDEEKIFLFKEISKSLGTILINLKNQNLLKNKLDKHQSENQEMTEANEILLYVNNFIAEIIKLETLNDVVVKILNSFYELYPSIKEVKFIVYKKWKKEKIIFNSIKDSSNLIIEKDIFDFLEEIKNKSSQVILTYNVEKVGFIEITHDNFFDMEKVNEAFINLLSLSISNILEKVRLREEIEEKNSLTEALKDSYNNLKIINTIGEKITSTLNFQEIGIRVCESIKEIFNDDCTVGMASYNREKEIIEFEFLIDYGKNLDFFKISSKSEKSFSAYVVRTGKPVIINDLEMEGHKYVIDNKKIIEDIHTQSLIFTPLFIRKEVVGLFTFQKKEKNFINKYIIDIINNISNFLAIALDNAIEAKKLSNEIEERKKIECKLKETNKTLKKLSIEDSLTKLYNRREFERLMLIKWNESKKENIELSLIIIDVDYFKQVNDTFGHLEGDRYLLKISNVLKMFKNENIFFGRYGGDEFVGLFSREMAHYSIKIAEKIKVEVKKLELPNPIVKNTSTTLTMGLASLKPSNDYDINDFFRKADRALYKGKQHGRDCIIKF